MSIVSVMPSNHFILCRPLLLLSSIPPSIRVFSNESALCIRWPKYWSFSFNISLSKEHSRLISFRMDWLDLLAVQGALKSLLQYHSSKASILRRSAFFNRFTEIPSFTGGGRGEGLRGCLTQGKEMQKRPAWRASTRVPCTHRSGSLEGGARARKASSFPGTGGWNPEKKGKSLAGRGAAGDAPAGQVGGIHGESGRGPRHGVGRAGEKDGHPA